MLQVGNMEEVPFFHIANLQQHQCFIPEAIEKN